jgi:hypothetical protein
MSFQLVMAGSKASGSDAVLRTAVPGHDEWREHSHPLPQSQSRAISPIRLENAGISAGDLIQLLQSGFADRSGHRQVGRAQLHARRILSTDSMKE